jgi:hypothetical protein
MFWSTTVIRELRLEPGLSYAYVKTIGKITSLCVSDNPVINSNLAYDTLPPAAVFYKRNNLSFPSTRLSGLEKHSGCFAD